MAPTVRPDPTARHYRRPSRVAIAAAPRLGMRPGSVEQLVHGHDQIHVRLAAIIEAAAALGDAAFIDRTLAPIDAARARLAVPALTPELIHQAQSSDAAEEVAESCYLAAPSLPHLRTWLHAVERQRADSLLLSLALRAYMEATA